MRRRTEGGVDPKHIRELIELVSESNVAELELEGKDFRLRLVRNPPAPPVSPGPTTAPAAGAHAPAPPAAPAGEAVPPEPAAAARGTDGLVDLSSPIVGTFYRSPSPDAPAFVEIGARIKKGQVVCIVEAMKVMNEIESEADGEVVELPVANGQPVEFGEVLLRLRPV